MHVTSIQSKYWKGDQAFLRELIKDEVQIYSEGDGCIWNISYPGHPLFIAHMDTVKLCDDLKPLRIRGNKIKRQGSALGADDRAGVNLIMNHHSKINWLFTRDEEIGRLGAEALAGNTDFIQDLIKVSCIVQLDCTGHKVVRGAKHGYCKQDLMTDLKKVIPDVKDSIGSYSDLDAFRYIVPGVNLSVGYYNQHTKREYLDITEYNYVNFIIDKLNETLTGKYKVEPEKVYTYNHGKYKNKKADKQANYYDPYEEEDEGMFDYREYYRKQQVQASKEYKRCPYCKGTTDTVWIQSLKEFVCSVCTDDIMSELIEIGDDAFENETLYIV